MEKVNNWDKVQAATGEREELPAGGYICRIMGAKEVEYKSQDGKPFHKLEISIKIEEGPYKGFYTRDYRSQALFGQQKWKGVLRPYCPTNGTSDQDRRSQGIFKSITDAIEASNPGYVWDWNENGLKGKLVGVMFRSEEWEFDGRTGWKTQPYRFTATEYIRSGEFGIPKPKPLPANRKPSYPSSNNGFEELSDSDLPF